MKTSRLAAILVAVAAVALLASNASAMYNPSTGTWMQRDPGPGGMMATTPRVGGGAVAGGAFLPRDQYRDGPNLYQYVRGRPTTAVDPHGTLTMVYKVAFNSEENLQPWWFHVTFAVKAALDEYSVWFYGLPNKSDYYALGQDITVELRCWNTPQSDPDNLSSPSSSGTLRIKEVLALYYDLSDSFGDRVGYSYNVTDHHQHGLRRSTHGDTTKACLCTQKVSVRSYILAFDGTDYDDLPFGSPGGFLTSVEKTGLYEDKPDSEIDGHMKRSPSTVLREVPGSSYSWEYEALYYPNANPPKNVKLRHPWAIHNWPY